MGKRKRKNSFDYIKKKIRKLEKRLHRYEDSDTSHSSKESLTHSDGSPEQCRYDEDILMSDCSDSYEVRSVVHIPEIYDESHANDIMAKSPMLQDTTTSASPTKNPIPSTSAQATGSSPVSVVDVPSTSVPLNILEVLGNPKGKLEIFGPKIQDEISKRWGRILCEGLNKDKKKDLEEKILIPENFQLVKAPKLNLEIAAVLNESARNRDKRLERHQNLLALGITTLTSLLSSLIDKDVDKMEIITRLSECNQLMLDLHYENTMNRRKLIMYSLDKKFKDMIEEVKRDSLLFGENLGEKIKASKSAEKSGLQIKKINTANVAPSKKSTNQQGNWKGPPRQIQRGYRRSGFKSRPTYQSSRKAPVTDRYQSYKSKLKPQTKSQ